MQYGSLAAGWLQGAVMLAWLPSGCREQPLPSCEASKKLLPVHWLSQPSCKATAGAGG